MQDHSARVKSLGIKMLVTLTVRSAGLDGLQRFMSSSVDVEQPALYLQYKASVMEMAYDEVVC